MVIVVVRSISSYSTSSDRSSGSSGRSGDSSSCSESSDGSSSSRSSSGTGSSGSSRSGSSSILNQYSYRRWQDGGCGGLEGGREGRGLYRARVGRARCRRGQRAVRLPGALLHVQAAAAAVQLCRYGRGAGGVTGGRGCGGGDGRSSGRARACSDSGEG